MLRILPGDLPQWWSQVLPRLEEMERAGFKFAARHIALSITTDEYQLWAAEEDGKIHAVMVTRIVNYPLKKAAQAMGCTGENMVHWVGLMPEVLKWAKSAGCEEVELVARPGWSKVLKQFGFHETHRLLSRKLDDVEVAAD